MVLANTGPSLRSARDRKSSRHAGGDPFTVARLTQTNILLRVAAIIVKHHPFLQIRTISLVSCLLTAGAFAAGDKTPAASEYKLNDWSIGSVLFGSKINTSELKGKVVVIEKWGVNCPPCIACLPHLAEMEKRNRDKGLVVIGAESQNSTKEAIKPLIEGAKVEYTITAGVNGPIEVSGIPHAFVFGRDGKLVFHGHPASGDFEQSVTKALRNAPPAAATPVAQAATGPLVPERAWTNSEGKEVRAAVKAKDATSVTFVMHGGKEVKYPLDKLSESSRQELFILVQ